MDTDKHEACVGFVGSSGVGKSRLLGELLYLIGGMDERTKKRLEQVSKQKLGTKEDWGSFFMMRNGDWGRGKSCNPHYMELFTDHSHLMVMDTAGSPRYRRNLLRGIFGVNEVVVVISAVNGKRICSFIVLFFKHFSLTSDEEADLNLIEILKCCVAFERRPIAVIVTHLDKFPESDREKQFDSARQRAVECLARAGVISNYIWRPEFHLSCSKSFQKAVFTLLLINTFTKELPMLPRDVVYLIVSALGIYMHIFFLHLIY
jgi:hypothetical protein